MLPQISFIVPVYNVEKYLAQCLDSLVSQNIEKEILIINDGSTDDSLLIAQRYLHQYSCITLINQHNKGLSNARNTGLQLAKGKYCYFIDSDDYLLEHNFKPLIELADQFAIDVFNGLRMYEYEDGHTPNEIRPPESPNITRQNQWEITDGYTHLHRMLERDWAPSVHYGFFRTQFLKDNHIVFPDGLKSEDALFVVDVYTATPTVKVLEVARPFYSYRQRTENSIMSTISNTSLFTDMFKICEHLNQRVNRFEQLIEEIKQHKSPIALDAAKQVKFDLIRIMVLTYGIAYNYQYLKYNGELKSRVKHYFTPAIITFMEQLLPYKIIL